MVTRWLLVASLLGALLVPTSPASAGPYFCKGWLELLDRVAELEDIQQILKGLHATPEEKRTAEFGQHVARLTAQEAETKTAIARLNYELTAEPLPSDREANSHTNRIRQYLSVPKPKPDTTAPNPSPLIITSGDLTGLESFVRKNFSDGTDRPSIIVKLYRKIHLSTHFAKGSPELLLLLTTAGLRKNRLGLLALELTQPNLNIMPGQFPQFSPERLKNVADVLKAPCDEILSGYLTERRQVVRVRNLSFTSQKVDEILNEVAKRIGADVGELVAMLDSQSRGPFGAELLRVLSTKDAFYSVFTQADLDRLIAP